MSKTLLTALWFPRRLKFVPIDVIDCSMLTFVDELDPISHVSHLGADASLEENCLILHINYDSHVQNEALHKRLCLSLIPAQEVEQHEDEQNEQAC